MGTSRREDAAPQGAVPSRASSHRSENGHKGNGSKKTPTLYIEGRGQNKTTGLLENTPEHGYWISSTLLLPPHGLKTRVHSSTQSRLSVT